MRPYLGPSWTHSHPVWVVDDFHHAPPIHGIQNTEIQKKVFCDVIASVLHAVYVYSYFGVVYVWLEFLFLDTAQNAYVSSVYENFQM